MYIYMYVYTYIYIYIYTHNVPIERSIPEGRLLARAVHGRGPQLISIHLLILIQIKNAFYYLFMRLFRILYTLS